ncbi:unnamed protein product [Lepeophtheirus salmonis]|uniref:(salmon louse) hypothetical protein n=1 Tax=Lepeophtheirus salmonis TaxID=72036 RepID=A0A7R8H348_LEPSM|nr:unnamed protein product [Lepeophtheirus salmonis]CAF2825359.1 unnamed protein product [Lepeophtheirus salmonis]
MMFSVLILPFLSLASSHTCETPTGPCIFPFKYLGTKYNGCIRNNLTLPWCATSVDEWLNYNKYDYCSPGCAESPTRTIPGTCKTVDGIDCVFPFAYHGTLYWRCTAADYGSSYWCATSVGAGNEYTSYGTCSAGCGPFLNLQDCGTTDDNSFPWCATATYHGQYHGYYRYCNIDGIENSENEPSESEEDTECLENKKLDFEDEGVYPEHEPPESHEETEFPEHISLDSADEAVFP